MLNFKCVLYTRLWATWKYNVRWCNDHMPNQMNEWMDIFPMTLSVYPYPYTKLILFWISVSNWLNYLFREISFRKSIKMTIKTHIKSGTFLFSLLVFYSNERYFALKILKYFISAMCICDSFFTSNKPSIWNRAKWYENIDLMCSSVASQLYFEYNFVHLSFSYS